MVLGLVAVTEELKDAGGVCMIAWRSVSVHEWGTG